MPQPVFDVNVSLPQFVWFNHFFVQCAVVSKRLSMHRKEILPSLFFFLNGFPAGESGATVEVLDFYAVVNECYNRAE